MVINIPGDYVGSLSVTFEGGVSKDYIFRIYNKTQARAEGYHIGATGNGVGNYQNVSVPIFISGKAGDHLQFQVYEATGVDPKFINAIFYMKYLHD